MLNKCSDCLETIAGDDLAGIVGGVSAMNTARLAGKTAARLAGRALPIVSLGLTGYDAYNGYSQARSAGKGVGESLWEGAKSGISSFTMYDLWGPVAKEAFGVTPAY